jgi:hypothetical protein
MIQFFCFNIKSKNAMFSPIFRPCFGEIYNIGSGPAQCCVLVRLCSITAFSFDPESTAARPEMAFTTFFLQTNTTKTKKPWGQCYDFEFILASFWRQIGVLPNLKPFV